MKNQELYQKTVNILVDAYMNDTLIHGNCCACAVGNIIAANCEFMVKTREHSWDEGTVKYAEWIDDGIEIMPNWGELFSTANGEQIVHAEYLTFNNVKREIASTGYQWQDLAAIEKAFETASIGESDDEWMFNGLMAVIDALDIIHENTDETATVSTKKRFAKV